jgi:hypothetical protein
MDLSRGAIKYADEALSIDPNDVAMHLVKARSLERTNKSKQTRAAADAGIDSCSRVACVEGLSAIRAELIEIQKRHPAIELRNLSTTSQKLITESPPPSPGIERLLIEGNSEFEAAVETDQPQSALIAVNSEMAFRPLGNKSAWNSKDTWEEADITDWAIEKLATLIEGSVCFLPYSESGVAGSIKLTSIQNAAGHAQVIRFQSKTRFLFNLSFELSWLADVTEAAGSERKRFKGKCDVRDLEQDLDDCGEIVISAKMSDSGKGLGSVALTAVRTWLEACTGLHQVGGGVESLRSAVFEKMKVFEHEMQSLTSESEVRATARSKRRLDESSGAELQSKHQQEAARAHVIADLQRANPDCKVSI